MLFKQHEKKACFFVLIKTSSYSIPESERPVEKKKNVKKFLIHYSIMLYLIFFLFFYKNESFLN